METVDEEGNAPTFEDPAAETEGIPIFGSVEPSDGWTERDLFDGKCTKSAHAVLQICYSNMVNSSKKYSPEEIEAHCKGNYCDALVKCINAGDLAAPTAYDNECSSSVDPTERGK